MRHCGQNQHEQKRICQSSFHYVLEVKTWGVVSRQKVYCDLRKPSKKTPSRSAPAMTAFTFFDGHSPRQDAHRRSVRGRRTRVVWRTVRGSRCAVISCDISSRSARCSKESVFHSP